MKKKINLNQLPNIITFTNFILGCLSILFSFKAGFEANPHLYTYSLYSILFATFLDFVDGKLSRYLETESEIGLQFDSMADLVSFGLAPTLLFHVMLFGPNAIYGIGPLNLPISMYVFGFFVSCIFCLSTLIRLARFNISPKSNLFIGMPSPIAGGTLALVLSFNLITPVYMYFLPEFILSSQNAMQLLESINTIPMNGFIAMIVLLGYSYLMNSPFEFAKSTPSFLRFSRQFTKKDKLFSIIYAILFILSLKHFILIYSMIYTLQSIYQPTNNQSDVSDI